VALTEAQRAASRLYLGYGRGRDLHPALESRWDALSPEEEAQVVSALALLAQIDAKLMTAALNNLDLQRAEDVTFLGPEQLVALRGQGRSLIRRLEITFELNAARDYFDTDGAAGMGGAFGVG
jgi:Lon protease-like protein